MPHRASKTESVVSLCILALLFLTAIGILLRQYHYDKECLLPATAIEAARPNQSLSANRLSLADFMPTHFRAAAEPQVFQRATLHEKINGKADLYLSCGFQKLYCQRSAQTIQPNIWMEMFVYDMDSPANAFSVFSQQRRTQTTDLSLAHFAYRTVAAVFFSRGNYYVEIIGSDVSENLLQAMLKTARNFTQKVRPDNTVVAMLELFPQENLIPNSHRFFPKNAFAFEGLTDTFTADYQLDGHRLTAFLSKRPAQPQAQKTTELYHRFLLKNGAIDTSPKNKEFSGRIVDFFGTTEIIFSNGFFVLGVHAAESQPAAERLAAMLDRKLSETVTK